MLIVSFGVSRRVFAIKKIFIQIDVVTNTDDVNGVVASGDEEDDKEYEVEKILKQKRERGKTLFLVGFNYFLIFKLSMKTFSGK